MGGNGDFPKVVNKLNDGVHEEYFPTAVEELLLLLAGCFAQYAMIDFGRS